MGFIDELRRRNSFNPLAIEPSGGVATPIFGRIENDVNPAAFADSMLPVYAKRQAMDLQDFKARTGFVNDLSVRQNNLQRMFDVNKPKDVVYNPNGLDGVPPAQRIGFELDKQRLGLEAGRQKETSELNRAKFGLDTKQYELDKEKNTNIYNTKQQEIERKVNESELRLKLAYDQLSAKNNSAEATAAYHKAQIEAANARHELSIAQRDRQLEESQRLHDAQIEKLNADMEALRAPKVETTEVNKDGTKKTVTTAKGEASEYTPAPPAIQAKAKPGEKYVLSPDGTKYIAVPDTTVRPKKEVPKTIKKSAAATTKVK